MIKVKSKGRLTFFILIIIAVAIGLIFLASKFISNKILGNNDSTIDINEQIVQSKNIEDTQNVESEVLNKEQEKKQDDSLKSNYKGSIPFLYYHSINDTPIGIEELSVKVSDFEEQIKYIVEKGYTPVHFNDFNTIKENEKPIVITFDDGYKDNFTYAYSILKKYNIKATIFIATGLIGQPGYLSLDDINQMKDLIKFENHTNTHVELTKVDINTAKQEILDGSKWIKEHLGYDSIAFCYPVGLYNQDLKEIVKKNFKYAVTLESGNYTLKDDPYSIPRIYVKRDLSLKDFSDKLQKAVVDINTVSAENIDKSNAIMTEAHDLYEKRNYQSVIQKAKEAIALNPENYTAYDLLGISYAFLGNYKEGTKNLEKSIALDDTKSDAYFNLALCYKLQKKYEDTIYYFDKTLKIDSKNAWCYYGKATIYAEQKDLENCIDNLKKAIEIDSTVKESARNESEFNPVKDSEQFKNLINR